MNGHEQDFREILHDKYEDMRRIEPALSMRQFAIRIGIAPSNLSDVFKGRCGLSRKNAMRIADALGMTEAERSYFIDLIESKHSRSRVDRQAARDRLQLRNARPFSVIASESEASIISSWHNSAVLEVISLYAGAVTKEVIAERLDLTKVEVETALQTLTAANLISNADGRYDRKLGEVAVVSPTPSLAIRQYQTQVLGLAQDAMMFKPMDQRDIWSTFFCFDASRAQEANRFLQKQADEFYKLFGSSPKADSVYCFAHQLFRVDRPQGERA